MHVASLDTSSTGCILEAKKRREQTEYALTYMSTSPIALEPLRYPHGGFLLDALPVGIIFQDSLGKILAANPAAQAILGLKFVQMRGCTWIHLQLHTVHEDGSAYPGETHPAMVVLATGLPVIDEVMGMFSTQSTEVNWINVSAYPTKHPESGEIEGVYTLLTNVNARMLAQQNERESEARFRSLFDNMSEGMALHKVVNDAAGRAQDYIILDTNRAFERQTGICRDAAVGRLASVVYGSVQPPFLDIYARVAQSRQPIQFDQYFEPLGRHFLINVFSPESGQFATIFEDITERKKLEDALKISEQRFRSVVENVNDVVFDLSPSGVFNYISPQLTAVTGFEPQEFVGQSFLRFVLPEDVPICVAALSKAVTTGHKQSGIEYRALRSDGSTLWLMANISVMNDPIKGMSVVGIARDTTERKRTEDALIVSESKFKKAFLLNPDSININRLDDGLYVSINDGFTRIMGYTAEDVVGHSSLEIAIWDEPKDRARLVEGLRKAGVVNNLEARFRGKDGSIRFGLMSAAVIEIEKVPHILSITRDITERKKAEEALELSASVFSHAREGILIASSDASIVDVNEAFTRITGYTREEVLGLNPRVLSSDRQGPDFYRQLWQKLIENGYWKGEIWNRRKSGEVYAEMLTISTVLDAKGNIRNYVALFTDITAFKEHQRELEHIAHFDALTNLPNRVLLADRLYQGMAQAQRHAHLLAVVFLDLDGFKAINDEYGHEVGDQLLITLASHMKQALREGDTLARIGGDEFVAVLLELENIDASLALLNRLLAAAFETTRIGPLQVQISASLGVTFYPQAQDVDADQLLRQADQAMYQAKLAGKNRYSFFDAEQDSGIRSHHQSVERIRQGLADDEFTLHYQPKVNMRTGAVVGVEALIRWQHPQGGLLLPGLFLPAIENTPLAITVGEWVIDTALAQIQSWQTQGLHLPVSVNVGARQLQQSNFVNRLTELLAVYPEVNPSSLEIEILETSALEDLAGVSRVIEECREFGVMFAMDDFGTGYSSLTYLRRLRVNLLKIDQSFVRDMLDDVDDLTILRGVIGLANSFRREAIAEGVETIAHGTMLLQLGCEMGQGYGIARPMPPERIAEWLASWTPDAAWLAQTPIALDDVPLLYARVEHNAWIAAIGAHLRGERLAPPTLDHHQCSFGQWFDGDGLARYGSLPAFAHINALHIHVHKLADELVALQADGCNALALTKFAELEALRDELLDQLDQLDRLTGLDEKFA